MSEGGGKGAAFVGGLGPSSIYLASALLSLCISIVWLQLRTATNPDALIYLSAADSFFNGRWVEGYAAFRWPFYSLAIAGVMTLTGGNALAAADLLNAALDCSTTVLFVALVLQLGPRPSSQRIAILSATVILLHPRLSTFRTFVIRDHGFYTFFVLALYLTARQLPMKSLTGGLATVCAVVAAALFRPEALLLLVVVPGYCFFAAAQSSARRLVVVCGLLLCCILLIPSYVLWRDEGLIPKAIHGELVASDIFKTFSGLLVQMRITIEGFAALLPPSRNVGILAYAGSAVAILLDATLRAVTVPIAALAAFAFFRREIVPEKARTFVLWFCGWQLLLQFVYVVFTMFLDWRYSMPISLMLAIPLVFLLDWSLGRIGIGRPMATSLFIALLAVLTVVWLVSAPKASRAAACAEPCVVSRSEVTCCGRDDSLPWRTVID